MFTLFETVHWPSFTSSHLHIVKPQRCPNIVTLPRTSCSNRNLFTLIDNLWTFWIQLMQIANVFLSFDFNLGMNKWRINMDKLKPINITRADSLLFQHIPYHPVIRGSPYLNGNVLKCTSQGAKADLFSQDLQICFTWNILYFEHNPPNTLSLHLFTFISFLFSQPATSPDPSC